MLTAIHQQTHAPLYCSGTCKKLIKAGEEYQPNRVGYELCMNCKRPEKQKGLIATQHYKLWQTANQIKVKRKHYEKTI